ncbi:MAG TPA: hypothetical protein VJB57_17725 [Dehalococcoidia bacterium]|nr:hypothetical protein [Dehalococcoidia bacterium]
MVTSPLVDERIRAGADLLQKLDEAGFDVRAAFWLYRAESSDWRLVLATPLFNSLGPKQSYLRLQKTVLEFQDSLDFSLQPVSLREISVVGPEDELVSLLRVAMRTGPGISGIRFTGNTISGTYIDDAYIYRLM